MTTSNQIEICFPVNVEASVAFWIERDVWNMMSRSERAAKVQEALYAADAATQELIDLSATEKSNLCLAFKDDEPGEIQVYDPND